MKTWTLWLSSSLSAGILVLAAAAVWRATPLAAPVTPDAGWWNGRHAKDFESHYDAVFPTRTLGINLWAAIGWLLFREGRPGVVVGQGDWLYSAEEFDSPPGADARIVAHLDQVAQVQRQLSRHGASLLVALVPAKARVHPEALGARRPQALHQGLYGHALAGLRARAIATPDLLAALASCKERQAQPMYLRTDTHWTPDGARCAAQRMARSARLFGWASEAPVRYRTSVEAVQPHRGDLVTFLPLDPWFEGLLPPAEPLELRRTEPVEPAAGLLDDAARPQVVLVGTSYSANPRWNFTGALQESLGEDVVNYANPAQGPFVPMLEYLASAEFRSAPPRLVIWEMPERYFPMADEPDSTPTEKSI